MITCTIEPDGTFSIGGIAADELVEIETALSEMFNRANRKAHKTYRGQLRQIISPVTAALDLAEKRKQNEGLRINI